MLLGRLRVREKLTLLVLLPLVAMVVATVPFVVGRVQAVEKARRSADLVHHAVQLGTLVQEVQQERLLAMGYLGTRYGESRFVVRQAQVDDTAATVRIELARHMTPVLDDALDRVAKLASLRTRVLRHTIAADLAFVAYTDVISNLINSLTLTSDADLRTPTGQQEFALDALIRHDEASAAVGAALLVPMSTAGGVNARAVGLVSAARATETAQEEVFLRHATPIAKALYVLVQEGPARQSVGRYESTLADDPAGAIANGSLPPTLLPTVESLTELSRLVQIKIAGDTSRQTASIRRVAVASGVAVLVLVLLLLALVVLLSVLVARAIAAPLRQLTASAEEVAEVAQAELTRVSDEERLEVAAAHLVPVEVGTSDELGELAAAFNRVQQVAGELVERQLISRRNVATMFGNVGRRTQNLVGRQLAMIDALERNEQDPTLLVRLYQLDHVSTRLRRNANSLVVLSGAPESSIAGEPMSIGDAIRSALGEIEGFQRVRLRPVDHVRVAPAVAPDVILLLAELLENSTSFSPPHTEVDVSVSRLAEGCRVRIVDHGIGMTEGQLAEENGRLVERERLDLAPTDVLGLFVVGRLARRHGIQVTLSPTAGSGVTADMVIPERLLIRDHEAERDALGGAGASAAAQPADVSQPLPGQQPLPERPPLPVRRPLSERQLLSDRPPLPARRPALTGSPGPPGAPAGSSAPAGSPGPSAAVAAPAPEALTAAPVPPVPTPREHGEATSPAGLPAETEAPAGGLPGVIPPRIGRRVRGAQLPETGAPAVDWNTLQPPEAARQTIEDFQAGVARARAGASTTRAGEDVRVPLLDRWERLRRRVPGAQMPARLPDPGLPGGRPATPRPAGPEPGRPAREPMAASSQPPNVAKALVEEFEIGVRRALENLEEVIARHARRREQSGANSPPPGPTGPALNGGPNLFRSPTAPPAGGPTDSPAADPNGRPPDAATDRAAATTAHREAPSPAAGAGASAGRRGAARRGAARRGAARPGAARPGAASGDPTAASPDDTGIEEGPATASAVPPDLSVPPAPPGNLPDGIRLTRRVPGAQLPETGPGAEAEQPEPELPAAQDPDAARALIDEFEAGVARALLAVSSEGASTSAKGGDEG